MRFKGLAIIGLVFLLGSCGGSKKATHQPKGSDNRGLSDMPKTEKKDPRIAALPNPEKQKTPNFKSDVARYIYKYTAIAKEEMRTYDIPASITLAQGILESSSGKGELTRKSNNHFGIKCNGWKGEKVYHDDDRRQECFRKYKNPNYSFRDHSLFLKNRRRYSALFELDIDDYKGWARGLKAAGYATDPAYPRKLISIVERYELYKYDRQVLKEQGKEPRTPIASEEDRPVQNQVYTVKKGDTLYSISLRFGLSVDTLKKRNQLRGDLILIGQKLQITDR